MAFNYDPKEAVQCWPEGDYQATIERGEERQSKAGNDMLVVTFKAYRGSETMLLNDYIVRPATIFKLKKIALALGRGDDFEAGKFNIDDYMGHNLTLTLGIEQQDGYDDQNKIKKYGAKSGASPRPAAKKPAAKASAEPLTDDDIPF